APLRAVRPSIGTGRMGATCRPVPGGTARRALRTGKPPVHHRRPARSAVLRAVPAAGAATVTARHGAVLLDLDGPLLDTAPDMVACLNTLRTEEGQPALPYALARDHVSNGALGLLRLAFGELDDVRRPRLHRRYLELYRERLCRDTQLFPGMPALLDE